MSDNALVIRTSRREWTEDVSISTPDVIYLYCFEFDLVPDRIGRFMIPVSRSLVDDPAFDIGRHLDDMADEELKALTLT